MKIYINSVALFLLITLISKINAGAKMPPLPYKFNYYHAEVNCWFDLATEVSYEDLALCLHNVQEMQEYREEKAFQEGLCSFICRDRKGKACSYHRNTIEDTEGVSPECRENLFPCKWKKFKIDGVKYWGWNCKGYIKKSLDEQNYYCTRGEYTTVCRLEDFVENYETLKLATKAKSFLADDDDEEEHVWVYHHDTEVFERHYLTEDGEVDYSCYFDEEVQGWYCHK